MLSIAICDDRPEDAERLQSLISGMEGNYFIAVYNSGEALLWDFESNPERFSLFFVDIYLSGISGVETARAIRSARQDALIVFASTSEDFYREAYDLFAFNYLVKPVEPERLKAVLTLAAKRLEHDIQRSIQLTYRSRIYNVPHSQILYLSSYGHQVRFHLRDGQVLEIYGKLGDFASQLPEENFLRCHQSFLVNMDDITALEHDVFRVNGEAIPISKAYAASTRARYREHLFSTFD